MLRRPEMTAGRLWCIYYSLKLYYRLFLWLK